MVIRAEVDADGEQNSAVKESNEPEHTHSCDGNSTAEDQADEENRLMSSQEKPEHFVLPIEQYDKMKHTPTYGEDDIKAEDQEEDS